MLYGVASFDLNGLKEVNDTQGHSAGDTLICRAARQLQQVFPQQVYRTGGDEFVVVDTMKTQKEFETAVLGVQQTMERCGIRCAVGLSWRENGCSVKEQIEEADHRMYQDKRQFYHTYLRRYRYRSEVVQVSPENPSRKKE